MFSILAATLVLTVALAYAPSAIADDLPPCTGLLGPGSVVDGNIVVNGFCIILETNVDGNIELDAITDTLLYASGNHNGNVEAKDCDIVAQFSDASMNGNFKAEDCSIASVEGTVQSNVEVKGSGILLIGATAVIGGNVKHDGPGPCFVDPAASVAGNLEGTCSAPSAIADDLSTCTGLLGPGFVVDGNIVVNGFCIILETNVDGNIELDAITDTLLYASGNHNGNVEAKDCDIVAQFSDASMNGNFKAEDCSIASVEGTVQSNVEVKGSGILLIGATAVIGGNVKHDGPGPCFVDPAASVAGNLEGTCNADFTIVGDLSPCTGILGPGSVVDGNVVVNGFCGIIETNVDGNIELDASTDTLIYVSGNHNGNVEAKDCDIVAQFSDASMNGNFKAENCSTASVEGTVQSNVEVKGKAGIGYTSYLRTWNIAGVADWSQAGIGYTKTKEAPK